MNIEEYTSVKKWFAAGAYGHPYSPKTQETYKRYMKLFSDILNMTPDELANLSSEQPLEAQIKFITELHIRTLSITQRVSALHTFWRANGVVVTEEMMIYEGTPKVMKKKTKKENK